MRKICFLSTLVLTLLLYGNTNAQDFSNRGKEFWLAYSYHVGMVNAGGPPVMTLYITSDLTTNFTVEIFGGTVLTTGTIVAGQVATVNIPTAYFINNEGLFTNKAIRVTAEKPIVVYSYITRSAASGATLCLPTAVLGREYVSMNYTQVSNEANSNSYITVIAVEDNTSVEITPAASTKKGWVAGTTYTVALNKGEIYQVLGTAGATFGVDLTGTTIRSVASAGGGCKKIAVFSGSGKISIGCDGAAGSSDNLYQQLYPVATWGKKYLTAPSFGRPNAIYRVVRSVAASNVYVNGALVPGASFANNVYEFTSAVPSSIESDQPISVAQYFTTQGCFGNASPYDPDMIILNPVEQNIDKVTLVSSNLVAAQNRQHHLQVIMKNGGTALTSFRLDGALIPPASWTPHPADPSYSYIYLSNVAQGFHTLACDTGFNALAYGYADAETYGYSAGSNIKDLYQFVTVNNQYATVNFPAACRNSPFNLSMTFPYQPTQIIWQFGGLFPDTTLNAPVFDEMSVVNGRTLYKYKLTRNYITPVAGTYPIKIVAQNPTADGCSGLQEIDYDLQVFDAPTADFNFVSNGCVSSPVSFTDNSTNLNGRPVVHRYWNFGDGNSQNDILAPVHTYAAANPYDVRYTIITDVGCKADTILHQVVLSDPPIARFTTAVPYCAGKSITFNQGSTAPAGSTIVKWIWNFGDNSPIVNALTGDNQTHTYAAPGAYTVTLQVVTATGCLSNVFTQPITIFANPVVDFTLPNVCLPAGTAQFNNLSTISDGTANLFTYSWNFGDASTAAIASPVHTYTGIGPYTVQLDATSNNGCIASASKALTTIYPEPVASFTAPLEVCLGNAINFTEQSTAGGSTVTQWNWSFGDATNSAVQNPGKTYLNAGTYTVTLSVTSAIGCQSVTKTATKQVVVNPLPVADFTLSLPGCTAQDITFTNTSIANAGNIIKWTWNYGDGPETIKSNGTAFTHSYAATNTYTATLQVETDKGCISTIRQRDVIVNPVPLAAFTPPNICVSDLTGPFKDESTVAAGNLANWQWNFGDANSNAGNPNLSGAQNSSHHYALPGNYTVQLITTSNAGCKDTVQHSFTVNGAVLTPAFAIQNTGAICSNKEIVIKDASQVDAGKIIRVEIFWDAADPTAKTIDSIPQTGKIYSHNYPEFGAPASKNYTIRYDVYSGIACVSSSRQTITVLATPTLAFDAFLPICSNAPPIQLAVQLQNALPGSGVFSGPGVSSTGLFNPQQAGSGVHVLTYTYNANNGCSNSITKTMNVDPTPVADAGPDKVVLEGGVVALTPKLVTAFPVTYEWSPPKWLNNPAVPNAQTSPADDFTYTLTVTSERGCHDSDQVFVKLLRTPVIPNIFSPNNDGVHDKWEIKHLDTYPGCIVQIYNRYGQMVYQIVNYTTPWDGRINGQDAPVGTYYYIIDPKNGRKPITGFVDIIR